MNDILFLPVKPKWADLIMGGKKTLELRKRLPSKGYNNRCVIYATSPRREIVGTCDYVCNWAFMPGQETDDRLRRACVSKKEFYAYFDDAYYEGFADAFEHRWHALELARPAVFARPVTLANLRSRWDLEPPQQWRYIDKKTFDEIVEAGR